MNDAQWGHLKTLSGEGGVVEDYAIVNGAPYTFGQVAERYWTSHPA
ncbi:MAG: hypothetical protein ABI947_02495 [Chloroflexota bacterium]